MKKILLAFSVLFALLLAFVSCASNKGARHVAHNETQERMFWRIDGTDKNGNPATVYIQGTIHLGDERLYPLAPTVVDAWVNADRIVGEISTADWAVFETEMSNKMIQSQINADGKNVLHNITSTQRDALFSVLEKEAAEQLAVYEPWVTIAAIETAVYLNSGLSVEKGMDGQFMLLAYQQGKDMDGLDSLETQLDVLQFGNYDEQLVLLKDMLDDIAQPEEINKYTNELYEAYLAGDVQKLTKLMESSRKEAEAKNTLYAAYYKAIFTERNKAWAEKIKAWIFEGGTTFIFAGCGHFVGDDSVFMYLKKNGALP
ncbi:MAG: TraB/GumN family protein [Treponema sp.]|nr:TraB/GumN family protein [Treponema sp.]